MDNAEKLAKGLDKLKGLTDFRLANEADTRHDNDEANNFLTCTRDALVEAVERFADNDDLYTALDTGEGYEVVEIIDYDGTLHEVADGSPNVYTSTRWAEFVGLGAYAESDDDGLVAQSLESGDMTAAAGVILYVIALRLCHRLLELLCEEWEEMAGEDEAAA